MKKTSILLAVLALLLITSSALALSSTHYRIDWMIPLTSVGGGSAASTHYSANYSIGQADISASSSPGYHVQMGYWYGAVDQFYRLLLPVIVR